MKSISDRLLSSAASSRRFLDNGSRDKVRKFILSRQNLDGGFRGRDAASDLYYTVFAVAILKVLGRNPPLLKFWKYVRSFNTGEGLDLVHLVCLIRLRTVLPMLGSTRRRLFQRLETHRADSAYGLFLKLLAEDYLAAADFPDEPIQISTTGLTTNLAASVLINQEADPAVLDILMARAVDSGGFAPSDRIAEPDLLSTAAALFALTSQGVDLYEIHKPCFHYIESLWRDSGGFAGYAADAFEDVEYTFYALLSIGCMIRSMAERYGC